MALVKHIQVRRTRAKLGHFYELGYFYNDQTGDVVRHYFEQKGFEDFDFKIRIGENGSRQNLDTKGTNIEFDATGLKMTARTNGRGEQALTLDLPVTLTVSKPARTVRRG